MTIRPASQPRDFVLTSVLWMSGFFFAVSALYSAHAQQHKLATALTFAYVTNVADNTVSVINTANNKVWPRFLWGDFLTQ